MIENMKFDINQFVEKYSKTEFILLFIFIFFILSIILAFVKFFSQWPILLFISFILAFIIYNHFSKNPDPIYVESKNMYSDLYSNNVKNKVKDLLNNSILVNGNSNHVEYS
jgi:hypothetical protein